MNHSNFETKNRGYKCEEVKTKKLMYQQIKKFKGEHNLKYYNFCIDYRSLAFVNMHHTSVVLGCFYWLIKYFKVWKPVNATAKMRSICEVCYKQLNYRGKCTVGSWICSFSPAFLSSYASEYITKSTGLSDILFRIRTKT